MAVTGAELRVTGTWAVVGVTVIVGLTALLYAQSEDGQPAQSSQPATTQASPADPRPPPTSRPAIAEDAGPAESGAKVSGADPAPPREPSPSEILQALTKRANAPARLVRPVTPGRNRRTIPSSEAIPRNAIRPPVPKLLPDGYRIVDRPGRLVREAEQWVFSFESRGRGAVEIPIRLLPNRLLEDMEVFSAAGTKPVVFVVSGEVTEYHSANYLLVQKLLTRPDLGNLE
jgi:hypothetical protein